MIFHINFEYAILGHKIFHRVLREELLELPVQLSGEGLIVRYDQSGLVQGGDDVGQATTWLALSQYLQHILAKSFILQHTNSKTLSTSRV